MLERFPDLSIAAINNPHATVVSGAIETLLLLVEALQQQEIAHQYLRVNSAFHSSQMDPLLAEFMQSLQDLRPQPAKIPLISTVTTQYQDWQGCTPAYWARNMREPVQFAPVIETLIHGGYTTFLEIGPHPIHLKDIAVCLHQTGDTLASLYRGEDERAS